MSDLRMVSLAGAEAVTFDLLQTDVGLIDETQELASAVIVALGTDRRALPDDELPNLDDDNRRGWWADHQCREIWDGWTIGARIWLLERAKITGSRTIGGSTLARAETYVREALQPFVDHGIASRIMVEAARTGINKIEVKATLYRGPEPQIQLQWQSLWDEIEA
jgi:phage gp46-like protein